MLVIANWSLARSRVDITFLVVSAAPLIHLGVRWLLHQTSAGRAAASSQGMRARVIPSFPAARLLGKVVLVVLTWYVCRHLSGHGGGEP